MHLRHFATSTLVLAVAASPIAAQEHEGHDRDEGHDEAMHAEHHPDFFGDIDADLAQAESKLLGLADAIPEDAYDWRPGEGVRSVRETLLHVAADNYFIPMALGVDAPASTGISGYMSTKAFEEQGLSKADVKTELQASFDHLRTILKGSDPMSLGEAVNLFGMDATTQSAWILTATHLHEHLGQMIAYARSNDVVPPRNM